MDLNEFSKLVSSRKRRSISRNSLKNCKPLMEKIKRANAGQYKKPIKTHERTMIVLPEMIGLTIHIHVGNSFQPIIITEDMLGLYFGELTSTRKRIQHSAPGVGATKSSTAAASKAK